MAFKMTARTILQLGAELISSDSIAFYELIKNAFDADSRQVEIDVYLRIGFDDYLRHRENVLTGVYSSTFSLETCKQAIIHDLDPSAPLVNEFLGEIHSASSFPELARLLDEANFIEIKDSGHGMSAEDLNEIYLTIGTHHRKKQLEERRLSRQITGKSATSVRPILGEKGLGRLSVMRLGWRLRVDTTSTGEQFWNRLDVNWREFADEEALVEDIPVFPAQGSQKEQSSVSGTRIRISGLTSDWSSDKLGGIARAEFSKLTDPFVPQTRYPINVRFNEQIVPIPRFEGILFHYSHATVEAQYVVEGGEPRFFGEVKYKTEHRETTFNLDKNDLLGICKPLTVNQLRSLGPFSVRFYWYNRRILTAIEGIGDRAEVRKLVNAWSGGLKVYRDGFRVNPYGSPDDDWLDLDHRALASSGYVVNRAQIIGVVAISSLLNPALTDQTNREGLRDTPEKIVLATLLKHLVEVQFRRFLIEVDKEVKAQVPASFEDLEERVEDEERLVQHNLQLLLSRYPEIRKDREIFGPISDAIRRIRSLMDEASRLAESYKEGHSELTNLAGIGLMVEIVAHELNRATDHTLRIIAEADRYAASKELENVLETLRAQMQTLQKRLRILDPLSTAGRQRKETFDLVSWVEQILASHHAQFSRHNVKLTFLVTPLEKVMRVRMVKGMCVQILENLLSNSMYWLKHRKSLDREFHPEIKVAIDIEAKTLSLTDNGPGIPLERNTQVFQPFFTTKPPGEGHGLGLYVSKEIANYNEAELKLSDQPTIHGDRLNTFVLRLKGN